MEQLIKKPIIISLILILILSILSAYFISVIAVQEYNADEFGNYSDTINDKLIKEVEGEEHQIIVNKLVSEFKNDGEYENGSSLYFKEYLEPFESILCRDRFGTMNNMSNMSEYTSATDSIISTGSGVDSNGIGKIYNKLSDDILSKIYDIDEWMKDDIKERVVWVALGMATLENLSNLLINHFSTVASYIPDPSKSSYVPAGADDKYEDIDEMLFRQNIRSEYTTSKSNVEASPAEAYILSELSHEDNSTGSYPSEQQKAWWGTEGGGNSLGIEDGGDLLKNAKAFETYINNSKINDEKKKYTVIREDGSTLEVEGYNLKEPQWLTGPICEDSNESYDNVTVKYNTEGGYYVIGPYALSYAQDTDNADFSQITSMTLFTDLDDKNGVQLNAPEQNIYGIIHCDNEGRIVKGDEDYNTEFPSANNPFYIKLKNYEEDGYPVRKITNLEVTVNYMNANASFDQLEGNVYYNIYQVKHNELEDGAKNYYIEAHELLNTEKWQDVTYVKEAFKWYHMKRLKKAINLNIGKIQIEKNVISPSYFNEEDEETTYDILNNKDFEFKLKVGKENEDNKIIDEDGEEETIYVTNKGTTTSRDYAWLGDEIPKFELKEIKQEGYEFLNSAEIKNLTTEDEDYLNVNEDEDGNAIIKGELIDGVLKINVTNKIKEDYNEGKIEIKNIVKYDESLSTINDNKTLEGIKLPVLINIYSSDKNSYFIYDNNAYPNAEEDIDKLTVLTEVTATKNGDDKVEIAGIKWLKELDAPKYDVEIVKDIIEDNEDGGYKVKTYNDSELTSINIYNFEDYESKIDELKDNIKKFLDNANFIEKETENISGIITKDVTAKVKIVSDQKVEKGKISITKKLDLDSSGLQLSDIEELKDKLNFEFEVTVGTNTENIVIDKNNIESIFDSTGKKIGYQWVWTSEEFEWLKGNTLPYTIKEIFNNELVCFNGIEKDADMVINGNVVSNKLKAEKTINNIFKSKINFNACKLKVVLDNTNVELEGKTFKYNIDIKGKFRYTSEGIDLPYGEHYIRLTDDVGCVNLDEEGNYNNDNSIDNTKGVNLTVKKIFNSDQTTFTSAYTSGKFEWLPGEEPTYKIEEDVSNMGDMLPSMTRGQREGYLSNKVTNSNKSQENANINTMEFEFYNIIPKMNSDEKTGKLFIKNYVKGISNNNKELQKNYEFKFKVEVTAKKNNNDLTPTNSGASEEKKTTDETLLKIDELLIKPEVTDDGNYIWEWTSEPIVWDPKIYSTPTYTITELVSGLPEGMKFIYAETANKYIKSGGKVDSEFTIKENTISGKIVEIGEYEAKDESGKVYGIDERTETTDNYFYCSMGTPKQSKIKLYEFVDKKTEDEEVKKVRIKIRGSDKFKYNNYECEADTDYYLTTEKKLITDQTNIEINMEEQYTKVWESNMFTWEGNTAPTYTVEVIDRHNYSKIYSGTDTLESSIEEVKIIDANETEGPKVAGISIKKKVEGISLLSESEKDNLDSQFLFKIEINGKTLYNNKAIYKEVDDSSDSMTLTYEIKDIKFNENDIYSITEIQINENIKNIGFVSKKDYILSGDSKTISHKLIANNGINIENKVESESRIQITPKRNKARIHITKIVRNNTGEAISNLSEIVGDNLYKFSIMIKGKKYYYGNNKDSCPEKGYINNNSLKNGSNQVVSINAKPIIIDWYSDVITWEEDAPTYEIEEKTNFTTTATISTKYYNKNGRLDECNDEEIINVVIETIINDTLPETRDVVIKTNKIDDIDNIMNSKIKSNLKNNGIKARLFVQGYGIDIVTLTYDKNEKWFYYSKTYNINNEEGLDFKVIEAMLPEGLIEDSGIEYNNSGSICLVDENSKSVVGKLKALEDPLSITFKCKLDKIKPKTGSLVIQNKSNISNVSGKNIRYKTIVSGTFKYYDEGNNLQTVINGEKEFVTDVDINGSKKVADFIWNLDGNAPSYIVEPVLEVPDGVLNNNQIEISSIDNSAGTLSNSNTICVTARNKIKVKHGYIKVTKQITDINNSGKLPISKKFKFRVIVKENGIEVSQFIGQIQKDNVWTSPIIIWNAIDSNPTYTVEEIDILEGYDCTSVKVGGNDAKNIDVDEVESPENLTNIVAITNNAPQLKEGKFSISQAIIKEDYVNHDNVKFKIKAKIKGNFICNNTPIIDDSILVTIELKPGQTWTSPSIQWNEENIPKIEVEQIEVLTEESTKYKWQNISISNNNTQIIEGNNLQIIVTDKFANLPEVNLTLDMGGTVWEETNQIGSLDKHNVDKEGVQVYITTIDEEDEIPLRDKFGAELEQPLITNENGHWEASGIVLPTTLDGAYNVSFIYDGQKYEPAEYLSSKGSELSNAEKMEEYKNSPTTTDSIAIYDKTSSNKVKRIYGNTAIDGSGESVGLIDAVKVDEDNVEENTTEKVYYESNANGNRTSDVTNEIENVASTLKTEDEKGRVLDIFKATARTYVESADVQLAFPYYEYIQLTDKNKTMKVINGDGIVIKKYPYKATYESFRNINLGLKPKENDIDIDVTKELSDVSVVVNDESMNNHFDNNNDKEFKLYKTDYYYRYELYKSGDNYDKIESFYNNMGSKVKDTEMEVYLTYNIKLKNNSEAYTVKINSLNDYYDSSLELLYEPVKRYIQKDNGEENPAGTEEIIKIENTNIVTVATSANLKETILGSDDRYYNKYEVKFGDNNVDSGLAVNPGTDITLKAIVKVKKKTIDEIRDAIILGKKMSLAEIESYSTYNLSGENVGLADKSFAPGNVNIAQYNTKDRYEDDCSLAPMIDLKLEDSNRYIRGKAWEDNRNAGIIGTYDDNEALIGGLTTQLVEKIRVKENDVYKEYDFIWPTNKQLSALGGKTFEYLTNFDSTIETSRKNGEVGQYKFINVPIGNYAVRFLYGIDKGILEDTKGITGDPVALNSEGLYWSNDGQILIANYDKDILGKTTAIYNGQDYQATYLPDENVLEQQIIDSSLNDKLSYAKDDEGRRLEVIANSIAFTNNNTDILSEANNRAGNHEEIYKNYYMFADSSNIHINGNPTSVENINIGLIQRPENRIILDKEISSIKLTTNDNRVIFNALYNINYEIKDDITNNNVIGKIENNYLCANVQLDTNNSIGVEVLQELYKVVNRLDSDKPSGTQNFKFINVDDTILQGVTIEINYRIYALNLSDEDYISQNLHNAITTTDGLAKAEVIKLAQSAKDRNITYTENQATNITNRDVIGYNLGKSYYLGSKQNDEVVVQTRIREIASFVDNDGIFSANMNNQENHFWKNTIATELNGNGKLDERILKEGVAGYYNILDKDNRTYVTDKRNNAILSIDTITENTNASDNSQFEKLLKPLSLNNDGGIANEDEYKSFIDLTVTRTVSSEDDADNLTYDSFAEIVKMQNTAGRRDETIVLGNASPRYGEFEVSLKERDVGSTEVITFTPPTGTESTIILAIQVLLITGIAVAIITIGIVIIKKKILIKK